MLKNIFQAYAAFTKQKTSTSFAFQRVIYSGGWWWVVDRYTVGFIAENSYFQQKTIKIPPTFGLHTFSNIRGIKLTGSSSSETFSREDTTKKDASIIHAQASCVFLGALAHLKHSHEVDSCNIAYTGKRVPPVPGARSQAGLPRASQHSILLFRQINQALQYCNFSVLTSIE